MKTNCYIFLLMLLLTFGCKNKNNFEGYETEDLKIEQVSENTFVHISYLNTQDFGKVGCNGMIVIDEGEAIVFDTPADDATSVELLSFIENSLHCKVKGIVVTHFHVDCLGGLNEFHKKDIPSYANNQTIELANTGDKTLPQNGFDGFLELKIGDENVICDFLGEGHTADNVIGYFPKDKALFGGCLIKSIGAGKGNLEDANVGEWSATVSYLKSKYGETKIVVPGHGKSGGTDLLDFTIEKFQTQ